MKKKCDQCERDSVCKGKCARHYKMPSQLNPKPINKSNIIKTKPLTNEAYKEQRKSINSQIKANSSSEIPKLLKEAEKHFNAFIRNRDSKYNSFTCISCGLTMDKRWCQAGHYFSKTISILRFNEYNVHGECLNCNCIDTDHLKGYRINLINKIGRARYDALYAKKMIVVKWDREELKAIIKKYKP